MGDRDDETLPAGAVQRWIGAYGQAWRDKDADAVAALFTPGASYLASPTGTPHRGGERRRP